MREILETICQEIGRQPGLEAKVVGCDGWLIDGDHYGTRVADVNLERSRKRGHSYLVAV